MAKNFNAGQLKHKVVILKKMNGGINENGFYMEDKFDKKTVRAQIKTFSYRLGTYKSSDLSSDAQVIKILIRYIPNVTLEDKVEVKGISYNIMKILNLEMADKFLELELE